MRAGSAALAAVEVVVVCAAEFAVECARMGMLAMMTRRELVPVVGEDGAPYSYKKNGGNGYEKAEVGNSALEDVVGGVRMWIGRTGEQSSVELVETAQIATEKLDVR